MGDEILAQRKIERGGPASQIVGGVGFGEDVEMEGFVEAAGRDALVDDVDRTADGLAPVEKDRGAAQDFDALGGQRLDRDGVVGRRVRHVDRPDPVDQDLDPLAFEAAQHRARGAGREAGRGDARLLGEDFADLAVHLALQFAPFDQRGAGEDVELLEARRGHDDQAGAIDIAIVEIVLCLGGSGRGSRVGIGGIRFRLGQPRYGCEREGEGDERGCDPARRVGLMIQHNAAL